MNKIPLQLDLSPTFPNIYGNLDYRDFRDTLIKIDEILVKSGFEDKLISEILDQYLIENELNPTKYYNNKRSLFDYKRLRYALRCNIARHLTGESYRLFSIRLTDSELLQWFTGINVFGDRKAASKSSLERYEKMFDEKLVAHEIHKWMADLGNSNKAIAAGLYEEVSYKSVFVDTTCVKAHIHFPVDWVLLRDAVRSLLSSIKIIRAQGLKRRMIEPKLFLKQINKLSMAMSLVGRKKDSKRQRKTILRSMKKLTCCILRHGKRYRDLLDACWQETDWSYLQALQVIHRIDAILKQVPAAIKQAHERIIGGRLVPAENKILSLYDRDAHVIVRGKIGSEVEFGQGLILAEQTDGLIIDWHLFKNQPPADGRLLQPALERIKYYYGSIEHYCSDRGFNSQSNDGYLKANNIYNATCPRDPEQLKRKLKDPIFISLQTRRSQTEARVGIFKNVFLGSPLRSRKITYKRQAINWCVLTHNLWVLSRKALDIERAALQKAA
jgi:IS5 family transposase